MSAIPLTALLLLQMALVAAGTVLPNDVLAMNGWWLFAIQGISLFLYLLPRIRYAKNLFLPSFFVLVYASVNLSIGGFLVPRGYGWDKQFAETARNISTYNTIVPYMLLANVMLLWATLSSLRRMRRGCETSYFLHPVGAGSGDAECTLADRVAAAVKDLTYLALFVAVSLGEVYSAFSLQLAIMVLHLSSPAVRLRPRRLVLYAVYLALLLAFSYENKREIAVALFMMVFLETYHRRLRFRLGLRSIGLGVAAGLCFMVLILAASLLRGYGDVPVASIIAAVKLIPTYVSSDFFIDGITDNLELNYSYGAAVTAIDLVLGGRLDLQYGASILKVFFLPVSRDVVPWKPESVIQLFTREYAPAWWAEEGSIPVALRSEMFVNFHFAGVLAYALMFVALNRIFEAIDRVPIRSVQASSCIFLSITVLFFARGSGIEQWILYWLIALPVFLVHAAIRAASLAAGAGWERSASAAR
jgi:hypothetical protein